MKTIRKIISLLLVVLLFFSLLSVTAFAWTTDDGTVIVYVTRTGEKYHSFDCGYLRSKIEITLEEAVLRGYSRCSRCNAPVYTGETPVKPTVSSTQSHYSSSGSTNSYQFTTKPTTKADQQTQEAEKEIHTFSAEAIGGIIMLLAAMIYWIVRFVLFIRKSSVYRKLVVNRKCKKLKKEIMQLNSKYSGFKKMRAQNLKVLCSSLSSAKNSLNRFQEKHYCKSNDKGYPVVKDYTAGNDYGASFTVCPGRNKYHRNGCRYSFHNRTHILDVPDWIEPCMVCKPPKKQMWMNRYVELQHKADELEYVICFPRKENKKTS